MYIVKQIKDVCEPSQSTDQVRRALALFNITLKVLKDEDSKKRHFYGDRKGNVFLLTNSQGRVLCTYATLKQIKNFVEKKITATSIVIKEE